MLTIKREFIHWDASLVEVVEKYPSHRIKNVDGLKDLLNCDTVLRKDEITYFCIKVDDAVLVESNKV